MRCCLRTPESLRFIVVWSVSFNGRIMPHSRRSCTVFGFLGKLKHTNKHVKCGPAVGTGRGAAPLHAENTGGGRPGVEDRAPRRKAW